MRATQPLALAAALLLLPLGACEAMDADDGGAAYAPTDTTGGSQWTDPNTYQDTAVASDTSSGGAYADASAPLPSEAGDLDGDGIPDNIDPEVDPNGDEFEAPGTNPFFVTNHDPLSTFGADVDTASYEIFKRDVQQYGRLPVPASVRLEEFVNYFGYDYAAPAWEDEHPFSVDLEAAPSAFSPTTLLRVGLQGKVVPPELKDPANLVFLVDVSGSMAGSGKLELVKVLLTETLDVLDPDDTVSIVTYASLEKVVLQPTAVSNKAVIQQAIAGLEASGSTAGERGLEMAYEMAQQGWIEGGINHVLLCTDGDFNVGISNTDDLVDFIVEKRETGITLTVVGFGAGNLNDAMMEAVSNAGNGVYSYIGDADSAVAYAHSRMLGNLYFIAKDLKIQVAFNPAQVYAYRLLGYENNAIADEDFVDDTVDAGEIGSGHSVTALYELVLTGERIPFAEGAPEAVDGDAYVGEDLPDFDLDDLVEVRVRYKAPDATTEDPATAVDFSLGTHRVFESFEQTSADFKFAAAVAAFAELLKDSPYAHVAELPTVADILEAEALEDPDRAELFSLFEAARPMIEAEIVTEGE